MDAPQSRVVIMRHCHMEVTNRWTAVIVLVGVSWLLPACNRAADIDREKRDVQQVLEKYLESVKMADPALASQVWLQSQDISVVTPFGRFTGWESTRDGLYVNFLQKAFTERSLRPDNLAITVSGHTAWAVFDWTFTAKLADGRPLSSKGWESHVYQKIDGRWVIVHLHYSVPPPPQ
jgi:ketosteroid isomerase-like protein